MSDFKRSNFGWGTYMRSKKIAEEDLAWEFSLNGLDVVFIIVSFNWRRGFLLIMAYPLPTWRVLSKVDRFDPGSQRRPPGAFCARDVRSPRSRDEHLRVVCATWPVPYPSSYWSRTGARKSNWNFSNRKTEGSLFSWSVSTYLRFGATLSLFETFG